MATCGKNKTRLIKVLVQGQKSAKQLLMLLLEDNPKEDDDEGFLAAADGFLQKILTSFSDTIHGINEPNKFLCKKRSASTSTSTSLKMDNRGRCYKKRISSSETQTKVSPTMEDGQAWRKYGQKVILNSKFPRSYFRCRHKHDQGCKATKQVQIMEEKPQLLYQTTYMGFHTCRDHITLKAPLKLSEQQDNMSDLTDNVNSPQPHITLKLEDHLHLHPSNNSVTHHHMYSSFGAAPFDHVTSTQLDHPDFRIDDLANWLDSV